jgi:hypothetical protein
MADIFKDILPSIMQNDKDVLENEKDYVPFVVNKALSYHYDCALQANEMNRFPDLPNRMQYDYLRNNVRKYKRRYQAWVKREDDKNIELIRAYYKLSYEKAKNVLPLFNKEQLQRLSNLLDTGGTK